MSFVCSNRRRGWRRAGVTSLEFALVAVAFFTLLIGAFDLGRYIFTVQCLESLLVEAGRYALLPSYGGFPACQPLSNDSISSFVPFLDVSNVTITVAECNVSTAAPVVVQVQVAYPFTAIMPALSALNGTITETATYTY